jgi:hypothetical protein
MRIDKAYIVGATKINPVLDSRNPWEYICGDNWTMTHDEKNAKRFNLGDARMFVKAIEKSSKYRAAYFLGSEFK